MLSSAGIPQGTDVAPLTLRQSDGCGSAGLGESSVNHLNHWTLRRSVFVHFFIAKQKKWLRGLSKWGQDLLGLAHRPPLSGKLLPVQITHESPVLVPKTGWNEGPCSGMTSSSEIHGCHSERCVLNHCKRMRVVQAKEQQLRLGICLHARPCRSCHGMFKRLRSCVLSCLFRHSRRQAGFEVPTSDPFESSSAFRKAQRGMPSCISQERSRRDVQRKSGAARSRVSVLARFRVAEGSSWG